MLSTSTVCGGRKYFVDMTIKTFCRLIELFSLSPSIATRKQWNRNLRLADTAFELKLWSLPWHVEEEISIQVVGETWEVVSVQPCPPLTCGLATLSQRNHCFWVCLVVTGLLMVVQAKTIGLLFLRGLAPLLWSPVLSYLPPILPILPSSPCMWPSPTFLGCGHTSDGIGSWQRSRMETWEWGRAMSDRSATVKAETFFIQDKSHPGEPQLLTAVPTLRVVVNPESMIPTVTLATGHLRRWERKGRGKTDIWDCFLFYHFLPDYFFFHQHPLPVVLTRQTWPALIPDDFCELCKCLRERWDSQEVLKRAGCWGLRNGRNAHMFSVCDTAADGNLLITQQDQFMLPLHQSLRCFPYL